MAPIPYFLFPGTAREALERYREVFGGTLQLFTRSEMGAAGAPDEIQHGMVSGPVTLYGADAAADQDAVRPGGVMMALLGVAEPPTLHAWFDALSERGRVIDPLARTPWGAWDGQVIDEFGVHWLIGYETDDVSSEGDRSTH